MYRSLRACIVDLEKHGHLVRISSEVDPDLEMAEIQRRVFQAGGPAVLYENVRGSDFPAVSNLFGSLPRARFIFRSTLERVRKLVALRADPPAALKRPFAHMGVPFTALKALPARRRRGPVFKNRTQIERLPAIRSWRDDGGPFITLPQVYTEHPGREGIMNSNLGMYRVQLSGNDYQLNKQVGLHYQIHRGIGVHHAEHLRAGREMPVSIFVGGPPAHTFAAVMPLPEGLPEVAFAGALAGRRFRYARRDGHVFSLEADFCIVGTVESEELPEGPFGDHLGYYSLRHDFPVLRVEAVYHRDGAVWPFTVVGRPPQEDTIFGALIHELTGPMVPASIPGLRAMHAVDAAGVHPLMLAVGEERYVPYESARERKPREILTVANAILGFGQASLAKYLFIAAAEDADGEHKPDIHDEGAFIRHVLERVDWRRDLHFHTRVNMDTLDYSGTGLNEGAKLVIAAAGSVKRELSLELPAAFSLPAGFSDPRFVMPGVLAIQAPAYRDASSAAAEARALSSHPGASLPAGVPLVILCDDSEFTARNIGNFLWVTFTRSNPSHDTHGFGEFIEHKHWGCTGALIIDARRKPGHAPPLVEDQAVTKRVDALFARGGPLAGLD